MLSFRVVCRLVLGWAVGALALMAPPGVSRGAPAADPVLAMPVPAPEQYSGNARHIGYGISVAPFVSTPNPAPLLDAMGLDWVKVYDTSMLDDFPNQHVLYRVDVPKDPADYSSWERGLPNLAQELLSKGVDAVEIGNEANLAFEWGGRVPDARLFTDALCRGYRAFKTYAPDIVVVAGGLAPAITVPDRRAITDLDFAQEMFNYGAAACFDAWGYHPYGFNSAPEADPRSHELVFRRTERMYRLLWNNGIRDKQIWITEFGWVRDPREDGMDCTRDPEFVDFLWMVKDRDTQAAYTARAFDFADRNWPWVGPMFLWNLNWNLVEPWAMSPCNHMRRFAILDNAGQPLPAFYAVQQVPKRPPIEYRPRVRGLEQSMSLTMEAGCTGPARLGSFVVLNSGYPGHLDVNIQPANGPGRPVVWTSVDHAESGTTVEVYVDATGLGPGIHLVPINLQAMGSRRLSTDLVRGYLVIHTPTTPACVAKWNNGG